LGKNRRAAVIRFVISEIWTEKTDRTVALKLPSENAESGMLNELRL
jgi:hypothetical protein